MAWTRIGKGMPTRRRPGRGTGPGRGRGRRTGPGCTVRGGAGRGAAALLALGGLACAVPAAGAGFDFFAQGGKASGMAGAFAAQADDLSAIFYNVGGLGLLPKKKRKAVSAVASVTALHQGLYQGLAPGIGTATTGEQETPLRFPVQAYLTLPLGDRVVLGMGAYTPFLLTTRWAHPESFAGRHLSVRSGIGSYDLSPGLGVQLTPKLGIGAALIYRLSQLTEQRRIAFADPLSGSQVDVASLDMKTDYRGGVGWSAGVVHKPSPRFSWGASYRSQVSTGTIGVGRLTQLPSGNSQLDQLVQAAFPFGQDLALASRIQFPSVASAGVALGLSERVLLELDANRTGWSTVQRLDFRLPSNPLLDSPNALDFHAASSYRAGLELKLGTGPRLRLGYAFEQTPQPDRTVGAFLPDSSRSILAAGFGLDWLDVAFNWVTYQRRIVTTNVDGLNGNWRANAWMVALSATK
jgi:long-chain fatty acid transport protein